MTVSVPRAPIKFLAVGVLSVIVDVGSLWLLHGVARIALPVATALAYGVAFFVNFFLNRAWTFRSPSTAHRQILRYTALVLANLAAVEGGVLLLTHLGLDYRLARATCTAVLFPVNYLLMRRLVFAAPGGTRPEEVPTTVLLQPPA